MVIAKSQIKAAAVAIFLVAGCIKTILDCNHKTSDGTKIATRTEGGSYHTVSNDQDSRSLLFNRCNEESNMCKTSRGAPGRQMYTNIFLGCSDICVVSWSVPLFRLLSWRCGTCNKDIPTASPMTSPMSSPISSPMSSPISSPVSSPMSSPMSSPDKRVCLETAKLSVISYQPYNNIILQGFDVSKVEWDVSFASRGTKIEFSVPYSSSGEQEALKTLIDRIKDIELDTSVGYEARLVVPDPTSVISSCDSTNATVHITVPKTANNICVGVDKCRPVICSLGSIDILDRTIVSYAPGNSVIFFGNSTRCSIQKPILWDDYISKYFNATHEDFVYYIDPDGDGASNIVEFHGIKLLDLFADSAMFSNKMLQNMTSTNPTKPDTDGDLLLDGYELLFGSNPLNYTNVTADSDGDGLTNLQEQIFGTNLFQKDTDNDGISDQVEVKEGSNPVNDADLFLWNRSSLARKLQGSNNENCSPRVARIRLGIGDPSGSESERYRIIVVGFAAHESPLFGRVDYGDYSLPAGNYTVRVEHVATKLSTPDFDYFASISSLESTAFWRVVITDPARLLGSHSESTYDYTIGRTATLSVIRVNATSSCGQYSTCINCRSNRNCRWDETKTTCIDICSNPKIQEKQPYLNADTCACRRCERWYQTEKDRPREWIDKLPKCPCKVRVNDPLIGFTKLIVNGSSDWSPDTLCNPYVDYGCKKYHPGAYSCIRTGSLDSTSNSGQQCCYDASGTLITHGRGAGTPDLVAGTFGNLAFEWSLRHNDVDVIPAEDCCEKCEDSTVCELYIGSPKVLPAGKERVIGVRQDNRSCAP